MVNVIYDKRKWRIVVDNEDCPHLFYPANIHGCKLNESVRGKSGSLLSIRSCDVYDRIVC